MRIFQSRYIHDYKLILEGFTADWGYIYYRTILEWCNIIDDGVGAVNKYWQVWLIEDAGRNIGICGMWSHTPDSVEELWLGWFGLIPEMRNKKIGGYALHWMEEHARQLGCKRLLSYVDKEGKPLSFYFRNGYTRICGVKEYLARHPAALRDNFEDEEDHVIMKELQTPRQDTPDSHIS